MPVRVVLGQLPVLLGDILRATLSEHPDLEVVSDRSSGTRVAAIVASTDADVAIIALPLAGRDRVADDLLREHPRLTVVALAENARAGCIYQLKTQVTPLVDVTPRSLLAAVRRAGAATDQ
jgi:DNA-binding NarL/FixJ family response regulator